MEVLTSLWHGYFQQGNSALLELYYTMYYYEKSFLNNKPCFIVVDPDGELNVFNTEVDASFFVDYLNNLLESN